MTGRGRCAGQGGRRHRSGRAAVGAEWRAKGGLVKNAGAAEMGKLADACHAMLPGMMERGEDRIISLASTAGLMGYPYVSAQRAP